MPNRTQGEGLETQQHVALPCESATSCSQVMQPEPTPMCVVLSGQASNATAADCACRFSGLQASHRHASANVASLTAEQQLMLWKQVLDNMTLQSRVTTQAAMMPINLATLPANQFSDVQPGVNIPVALDTAAMCPMRPMSTDQALLLAVLSPGPIVMSFTQQLDSASKLALFRTCKLGRDTLLRESDSIRLGGRVLEEQAQQHLLSALQLASKHGSNISLVINRRGDNDAEPDMLSSEEDSEEDAAWARQAKGQQQLSHRSYAFMQEGHSAGLFHGVSRLELSGIIIDSPLPSVLGDTLPHLTALGLLECLIKFKQHAATPHVDTIMPAFLKLQTLQLHDVAWRGPIESWKKQLPKQIAQLPALSSLSLMDGPVYEHDETDYGTLYCILIEAAASQLTHLDLDWEDADNMCVKDTLSVAGLGSRWLVLQSLNMWHHPNDEEMSRLLTLPRLTHLSIPHFNITQSFAGCPCSWQSLELYSICVEELAWLPLHPGLLIKALPFRKPFLDVIIHSTSRATVEDALANITKSGWPSWQDPLMKFRVDAWCAPEDSHLVQVLPLLSGVSYVSLDSWRLSAAGAHALGDFACKQQQGFHLEVHSKCPWSVADMVTLVTGMPAGSHLTVVDIDEMTFTQLCCASKGQITMHAKVRVQYKGGFCERLQAALVSCGQHSAKATGFDKA